MCVAILIMHKTFDEFITIEALFQAWDEFKKEKRKRADVQLFERHLEVNMFSLDQSLKDKTYRHGGYYPFYVHDPKQRHIHKAQVCDRVVHHLLYTYLYDLFDKSFIFDSYSCRLNKGTHKGVDRLETIVRKVAKNHTRPCFALKLDIKRFFASVDHQVLKTLLERKIKDKDILWLLDQVIDSFQYEVGKGIPLGNLTSQVFANIYLHELDFYIKQRLKVKHYLRYADDFILLSDDLTYLRSCVLPIQQFLETQLKLILHPKKIIYRKLDWGIDFLGYVVLPHYRLPRTKTKKRIFKKLQERQNSPTFDQSLQSYLGYLSHASAYKVKLRLLKNVVIK